MADLRGQVVPKPPKEEQKQQPPPQRPASVAGHRMTILEAAEVLLKEHAELWQKLAKQ